jgi:hypothetical protein
MGVLDAPGIDPGGRPKTSGRTWKAPEVTAPEVSRVTGRRGASGAISFRTGQFRKSAYRSMSPGVDLRT